MSIVKAFEAIGAKARIVPSNRFRAGPEGFSLDIVHERGEEIFEIRTDPKADLELSVVDKRPSERHLLLMVKTEERAGVPVKSKFLCGHDEFHWFAAPVNRAVADVPKAKESLRPAEVVSVQERQKGKHGTKKVKGGVKRQGEWFFIPKPSMKVPANLILKDEPVRREGGKPHVIEEVYRLGGDTVYENARGVVYDPAEYRKMVQRNPGSAKLFRAARVNARVFGRGKVRHPDHSTIELKVWHQVVPNTEHKFATKSLRFVD